MYKPAHGILILVHKKTLANVHPDVSSHARDLNFGLSLHLNSYFVYACSNALVSLHIGTGSPELSLLDNVDVNKYQNH